MKKYLVAVDADRTLFHYDKARSRLPDGRFDINYLGDPIPGVVDACRMLLAQGHDFRIFTARAFPRPDGSHIDAIHVVEQAALKLFGRRIVVTCMKSFEFDEIWDDMAISIEANTGRFLVPSRVLGPPAAQLEMGSIDGGKL